MVASGTLGVGVCLTPSWRSPVNRYRFGDLLGGSIYTCPILRYTRKDGSECRLVTSPRCHRPRQCWRWRGRASSTTNQPFVNFQTAVKSGKSRAFPFCLALWNRGRKHCKLVIFNLITHLTAGLRVVNTSGKTAKSMQHRRLKRGGVGIHYHCLLYTSPSPRDPR